MNRNRLIIGLAAAIAIAAAVSFFVYRQFKRASAALPKPIVMQQIVVAASPLQLGTRVDANNLRLIPWPTTAPVAGMFTRIEDCAGRALITPVAANEPIIETKLASKLAGAGLPATIPEGMRALSVAVNEVVGVAGFVIPGTMVDVLATGRVTHVANNEDVTRTILENIRVLAAGQKIEQDREGKPQTVPVITLLVTPQDAAKLAMASTQGKIQLALRNTIDSKITDPAPVLEAALFSGGAPAPAKHVSVDRGPAPYVVEVIAGTKRENKSFNQ